MSKELEALRMLKQVCLVANVADMSGQINIVEAALKRLELLESNQLFIIRAKKLKALEIIKYKRLNVDEIYHKDYEWYLLDHENDDYYLIPTEEEYYLVKEVLYEA